MWYFKLVFQRAFPDRKNGELVKSILVIPLFFWKKYGEIRGRNERDKHSHFCKKRFFQLMLFLSLNNFISALFIDKTFLSLTYHLAKHWSLKDELGSFHLTASLRLWFFPQMGLRNSATIMYTENTLPLPPLLSALSLRLHNSEVVIDRVSSSDLGWTD